MLGVATASAMSDSIVLLVRALQVNVNGVAGAALSVDVTGPAAADRGVATVGGEAGETVATGVDQGEYAASHDCEDGQATAPSATLVRWASGGEEEEGLVPE